MLVFDESRLRTSPSLEDAHDAKNDRFSLKFRPYAHVFVGDIGRSDSRPSRSPPSPIDVDTRPNAREDLGRFEFLEFFSYASRANRVRVASVFDA